MSPATFGTDQVPGKYDDLVSSLQKYAESYYKNIWVTSTFPFDHLNRMPVVCMTQFKCQLGASNLNPMLNSNWELFWISFTSQKSAFPGRLGVALIIYVSDIAPGLHGFGRNLAFSEEETDLKKFLNGLPR